MESNLYKPDVSISTSNLLLELKRRLKTDPDLRTELEKLLNEKTETPEREGLEDRVSLWVKNIKEKGAAVVNSKAHPDWFTNNKVVPSTEQHGYDDMGHINARPTRYIDRSPLSGEVDDMFKYKTGGIDKKSDQIILIGNGAPPSHEYNQNTLNGRFNSDWTEINWGVFVDRHPDFVMRNQGASRLLFKIFLPTSDARKLFQDIQEDPNLPENLFRTIYPNVPEDFKLTGKNRLAMVDNTNPNISKFTQLTETN